MLFAVALEEALTLLDAQVFELASARSGILAHDACVKVNQMRVVGRIALCRADAMGVVTGGTGNTLIQMAFMAREAFITHNAVA